MSERPAALGRIGDTDDGRQRLGTSSYQLWIGYFGVGGNSSVSDLEKWLSGAAALPSREHNLLAQALNDEFTDSGLNHPVPYSGDI